MKSVNRRRGDTKRKPLINLYYFWLLLILLASALIWFANVSINNTTLSIKKDGIVSRAEDKIPPYHDYAVLFVMYHKTGW